MIASRMICYGLLLFTSLALALFCMVLWFHKRKKHDPAEFYFGMLCLAFSLRVSYPFLRLWGIPSVRVYALEDAACTLSLGMCGAAAR